MRRIAACEWIDPEWIENLLWCPSQCYRRIECCGKLYTLYLRWRWEDPWQFEVAEGDMVRGTGLYALNPAKGTFEEIISVKDGNPVTRPVKWRFVTNDLFEELGYYFKDEEYKKAEKKAEELFFAWLKGRCKDQ